MAPNLAPQPARCIVAVVQDVRTVRTIDSIDFGKTGRSWEIVIPMTQEWG